MKDSQHYHHHRSSARNSLGNEQAFQQLGIYGSGRSQFLARTSDQTQPGTTRPAVTGAPGTGSYYYSQHHPAGSNTIQSNHSNASTQSSFNTTTTSINKTMYGPTPSHHISSHGSSASISGPFYGLNQPMSKQQQDQQVFQQVQAQTQQGGGYLPRRSAYFESHWPLYGANWTFNDRTNCDLIATSTFTEDANNRIQVLHANGSSGDEAGTNFQNTAETLVPYPITKLAWEPPGTPGSNRLVKMVSTSDCLRLWDYDIENGRIQQRSALINKSKSEYMPPLTSFDWNKVNPSLVITSSIDTTCTIWDIGTSTARTQLIAHDNEVYDVTFVAGSVDIFTSVGADGSVRVFDLRSLDHSTIIYEPSNPVPLVRIAANPFDRNTLAAIAADSNKIMVLDIRSPGTPLTTLEAHSKTVNSIAWMPPSNTKSSSSQRHILASGGDDCQVLLWDLTIGANAAPQPLQSVYTDCMEVNNLAWNSSGDWLGVVSGRGFQGVRV